MDSPRVIGYLLEKLEGRHPCSLEGVPLCRSVLNTFHTMTGCVHGDANRNNFIIKPDGSAALILDFERAEEEENEKWMVEELEMLEPMQEDEEAKQEMGAEKWGEEVLRGEIELMAPLSEEDELRRDEVGMDEWIEERVKEQMRKGRTNTK